MVAVFDVNETLVDLAPLDSHFERLFGDAAVRNHWFALLLRMAMTQTLTRCWADFGAVARSALDAVAARRRVSLSDQDRAAVFGQMRALPPHPDVKPALELLCEAGVRTAALSNSPGPVLEAQLDHAGLTECFERILSVDAVRKLKPHPDVYRMACRELGVAPWEMVMVAAHPWDTTGAVRAGCRAAFVARDGSALSSLDEPVLASGRDLEEVAKAIIGVR